ncbi:Hsp90 cochaperone shq1, partial [Kappamyces sp. JEL0680]
LAQELIDVKDLDTSTVASRRSDREAAEELKFDPEYYMWDSCMNEDIEAVLQWKSPAAKALKRMQKPADGAEALDTTGKHDSYLEFTAAEQAQMRSLANKEYLIDKEMLTVVYFGLVDILFAYCFNCRMTEGEDTVESAWNICRLSGTLSAFDSFTSIESALACSLRRCLSFPLYRSFALAEKVHSDLVVLLKLGKRAILKALLHIKQLLSHHDQMFLMDRIYITDYCIWIQTASNKRIASLASLVHHTPLKRELSNWPLLYLEQEAQSRKRAEEEMCQE